MPDIQKTVVIVGTGFVADFYMRSKELHSDTTVIGAFDLRSDRLDEFHQTVSKGAKESVPLVPLALSEQVAVLTAQVRVQ